MRVKKRVQERARVLIRNIQVVLTVRDEHRDVNIAYDRERVEFMMEKPLTEL